MTKAYLIDVFKNTEGEVDVTDWKQIAPLLNCDLFDTARLELDGQQVIAYVDDEGLLKDELTFGAMKRKKITVEGTTNVIYSSYLAGNILVMNSDMDEEGYELDLTDEKIEAIKNHIEHWGPEKRPVLMVDI